MGTTYYALKDPVTKIGHCQNNGMLAIEIDGKPSGVLTVPASRLRDFIWLFADRGAPMLTINAGADGPVYRYTRGLNPDMQLISEYGELTTLKEAIA